MASEGWQLSGSTKTYSHQYIDPEKSEEWQRVYYLNLTSRFLVTSSSKLLMIFTGR